MLDDEGLLTCIVFDENEVRDNLVHWAWAPDVKDACAKFPWKHEQITTIDCGYDFICSICGMSFREHDPEECDG